MWSLVFSAIFFKTRWDKKKEHNQSPFMKCSVPSSVWASDTIKVIKDKPIKWSKVAPGGFCRGI